jgi:hypothetical protein
MLIHYDRFNLIKRAPLPSSPHILRRALLVFWVVYFYAVVTEGESASRISSNSKLSSAFALTSIKLIAVIRIVMDEAGSKN